MLGAAGFLGIESVAPSLLGTTQLGPAQLAAGTLIACGAAMIPDIDHPQATLARSLPPVSNAISRTVNMLAGGHRKGTHTIWCWALITALAYWGLQLSVGPIVALIVASFCALLFLRVLTESDGLVCLLLACVLGGAAVLAAGPDMAWIEHAIFIGFGLHLLGDIVTTEGIPMFYPFWGNQRIPVLGDTDHFRERTAGTLCGFVAFYLLVTVVFLPGWSAQQAQAQSQKRAQHATTVSQKPSLLHQLINEF